MVYAGDLCGAPDAVELQPGGLSDKLTEVFCIADGLKLLRETY